MSTTQQQPLAERSPNSHHKTTSAASTTTRDKMADLKSSEIQQQQTYVSPSDTIMSPTTKKLSEIKGKRFNSGRPQSLFAKTVSRQGMKSEEKLNAEVGGNRDAAVTKE